MAPQPLAGRRILVTRAQEGNATLGRRLRELGAEAIEIPLIRIEPPASYALLDKALAKLDCYDALLVTSASTARVLGARKAPPWLRQPFTAAIGPATAEALHEAGLRVDVQPEPSVAESLVRELAPRAQGKRMLLPRAQVARDVLPEALRAAGAIVDVVDAYRTVPAEESRAALVDLFASSTALVDAVTFTSGSTVENFFALLGEAEAGAALSRSSVCSIGPITTAALQRRGVEVSLQAATHDLDGLVAVLRDALAS